MRKYEAPAQGLSSKAPVRWGGSHGDPHRAPHKGTKGLGGQRSEEGTVLPAGGRGFAGRRREIFLKPSE